MPRRGQSEARCPRCRLHLRLCLCDRLPRLELRRTSLVLLLHRHEALKSTNTGRLLPLCIEGAETRHFGHRHACPAPPFDLRAGGRQPLVLFPSRNAARLDELELHHQPVSLIVPDGTWRQTSRVMKKLPWLAELQAVTVPLTRPSGFQLRTTVRQDALATAEAAATALGILEGLELQRALMEVFRIFVDRTLYMRGDLPASRVHGGVP